MTKLREQMPQTADTVDWLREQLGSERVDKMIAAGVRAQREFARLEKVFGRKAAQAWLAAQPFRDGCFHAVEGGHEVGVRRPE